MVAGVSRRKSIIRGSLYLTMSKNKFTRQINALIRLPFTGWNNPWTAYRDSAPRFHSSSERSLPGAPSSIEHNFVSWGKLRIVQSQLQYFLSRTCSVPNWSEYSSSNFEPTSRSFCNVSKFLFFRFCLGICFEGYSLLICDLIPTLGRRPAS